MKEFIICENDAGQRLDRFIGKAVPLLPPSLCQKYIRKKRIKLNGKPVSHKQILIVGDVVTMYVNDEFFAPSKVAKQTASEVTQITQKRGSSPSPISQTKPSPLPSKTYRLDIVYEDENILLLNKPAGILCHSNSRTIDNSLLSEVLRYLQSSGKYDPFSETTFAPALCNRIDRNTRGIVIAAKNAETLRIINEKIRNREIDKYYLAVVSGHLNPPEGTVEGFWTKDNQKNKVNITIDGALPDSFVAANTKRAVTEYKTIASRNDISLVECMLVTGRSHQIRAHLSAMGSPIVGDKKYGGIEIYKCANNTEIETFQALCSYKLKFSFTTNAGILSYLSGKTFKIENIPFVEKYFGEISY